MPFSMEELPQLIDITAVAANATITDVDLLCQVAAAYSCASTFVLPSYLSYTIKKTAQNPAVKNCSVAGFPFGGELTSAKVYEAKQVELLGAKELDIVMNVGAFLSGNLKYTKHDIEVVCEAVSIPVKVIIETPLLSEAQIAVAAEVAVKAGAAFVKTSTGFYDRATTVQDIKIIKDAIGDAALIKAAGGVRSVDTMLEMIDAGASRFGIGAPSAIKILHDVDARLGREPLFTAQVDSQDTY